MREAKNLQTKQDKKGNSRAKRSNFSTRDIVLGFLVVIALSASGMSGFYVWKAQHYQTVFFLNTFINGTDASGKTVDEVKTLINSGIDGYQLTIQARNSETEILTGESIGLHSEFDGTLEQILTDQNPYAWGIHYFNDSFYQIETMIAYDRQLFEKVLAQMEILDPDLAVDPEDAYLSDYISGQGYEIVPEKEGTLLDETIAGDGIRQALLNLKRQVSLEELGAYIPPPIRSTDERLNEQRDLRNRYIQVTITHEFGDKSEVLDGEITHKWLSFSMEGNVTIDEAAAAAYAAELAKNYNTAYQPKTLVTSYGETVTVTGGNYGWRINQSAETAAICEIIRSGESQTREPIYSQTAASHGANDYGDTYVEINLTAQHLHFYKDGSLLTESDFVSGNASKGFSTPAGAYPLTYKQRNATLKGEGYTTPVSYWMPFNGGVGMHDASWRGSFGGTIYKTNGSHGCVNLPPEVAKVIYENISAGMPVLCYHLGGTEGDISTTPETPKTLPQVPETEPEEASQESTEAVPEGTAAAPETEPESEYPVILAPGAEPSAAETEPETGGPSVPGTSETEERPIIGPGGVDYEPEEEVGPGV